MADINPDELAKTVESIILALTAMGVSVDGLRDKIKKEVKDRADSGMKSSEITKLMITQAAEMRKTTSEYKSVAKSLHTLKKGVEEGTISNEKMNESLRHLRREIDDTTDENKRARLIEKKSYIEAAAMRINAEKEFTASLGKMATSMGATMIGAFTNAAKAAMTGQDALSQGAEMMKSQWDTLNSGVQAGANGLQKFGESTAGAGGKVGKFGIIASGAGAAISFLSNSITDLAKAGIGFMLMQTNKMITGFQTMSSAGALYVGGMTRMTETALSAGMTIEQFSKAVGESKENLSKLGMGVGAASKKMADAMRAGGDEARRSLFSLGMGMEEQASMYAEVMAGMTGPAGKLNASNEQIAARTQEYAKNLKMLSDLTGEDMKSKQQKIQAENDTLAFQLKLDAMSEDERSNVLESMKGMSDIQRKALRERMIHGTIISEDVGIAEANNAGLRKTNESIYAAAAARKLDLKTTLDAQEANKAEFMRDARNSGSLAAAASAGDASAQGAAKGVSDTMKMMRNMDPESRAKIEATIKKETADANKKDKDGNLIPTSASTLMDANQKQQVDIQKIATDNLEAFSTALTETINSMRESVKGLVDMSAKGGGIISKIFSMDFVLSMLPVVATLVGGYMTSKAIGGLGGGGDTTRRGGGGRSARGGGRSARGASAAGSAMEGIAAGAGKLGGGVGEGITGILSGIAKGIAAFGNPKVLFGIVNLGLLGGAMMITGLGFKQFMDLKWDDIGKAVVGIAAIATVAGIIGIPVVAAAIALGAVVIAGLGLSIGILGAALKSFPTGLFDGLTDMFSGMGKALGGMFGEAWSAVSESFSNAWGVVKKFASDFIEPFKGVFGWISDKVTVVTEKISGAFKWAFSAVGEKITWVWDKVSGVFGWMADAAGSVASAIGAVFKFEFDIISGVATWLGDKISGVWESVTGGAKAVGTAIKAAFTGSIGWVSDKIEKLGDTFSKVFTWIKGIAKDMFAIILDPIKAVMNLFEGAKKLWDKLTGKSTASTPEEKKEEEAAEKQEDAAKDFVSASNLFFKAVNKFASVVDTMVKGGGGVVGGGGTSGPANAGGPGSGQAPAQTSSKPPDKVEQTAPPGKPAPGKPTIPDTIKPNNGPLPGGTKGLLEQIARGEGTDDATAKKKGFNSGYDVSLGYGAYGKKGDKPLSEMTFGEVKEYQKSMLRDPKNKFNSSAVGKYQFISGTLKEQQEKAGYKDTDKFDAAAQDKMGVQLLKQRGLDKYTSGKMSADNFQTGLAKEWASVADSKTGKSFYGQHTGTSDLQIKTAIAGLDGATASATEATVAITKAQESSKVSADLTKTFAEKTQAEQDAMRMGRGRKGPDSGPTTVDAANKAEMESLTKRYGKTVNAAELRIAEQNSTGLTSTVEPKSPWDGGENARVRMNSATVGMENYRVPQYRNQQALFDTVAANRGVMPTELTGGMGPDGKRGKDPLSSGFGALQQIMSKVADYQEQSVTHQQSLVGLADDSRGIAQRSLHAIE